MTLLPLGSRFQFHSYLPSPSPLSSHSPRRRMLVFRRRSESRLKWGQLELGVTLIPPPAPPPPPPNIPPIAAAWAPDANALSNIPPIAGLLVVVDVPVLVL